MFVICIESVSRHKSQNEAGEHTSSDFISSSFLSDRSGWFNESTLLMFIKGLHEDDYVCPAGCLTGWWKWFPNPLKLLDQTRQPRLLLLQLYGNTCTKTLITNILCVSLFPDSSHFCLSDLTEPTQKQKWWVSLVTSFMLVELHLHMCITHRNDHKSNFYIVFGRKDLKYENGMFVFWLQWKVPHWKTQMKFQRTGKSHLSPASLNVLISVDADILIYRLTFTSSTARPRPEC